MSHRGYSFSIGAAVALSAGVARAENVIVIPGRPEVPVIINYYDARWAIVEGEEGLNRPGHVVPNVIGGRFVGPLPRRYRPSGYFPSTGIKPQSGRVEQEPTTPAPTAAESFSRSWSTAPSPAMPATSPETVPPADLPNPNAGPTGEGGNPPILMFPLVR